MIGDKSRKIEILKSIEMYLIANKGINVIDSYNDWSINYFKQLLDFEEVEFALDVFNSLAGLNFSSR